MKNYILAFIIICFFVKVDAQTLTEQIPYSNDSRVITTGVPFLLIAGVINSVSKIKSIVA